MRYCALLFCITAAFNAFSQKEIRGVIADSATQQPLSFATIRVGGGKTVLTGINGYFSVVLPAGNPKITVSYVSYSDKHIYADNWNYDTLLLVPAGAVLGEVIISSQNEKIKRIINTAVRNKSLHNPEFYDLYLCNIYYKMKVDLLPDLPARKDSVKRKQDSIFNRFTETSHLLLSETFSRRMYKRPQQLQETVVASRFSGLKKTYFTNLVTDVLPFHMYSDYISMNGRDYINPISKGWQQRYDFRLYDEISDNKDTIFIFSFEPKKKVSFNSLMGLVYINSDGYAISHFIGSTGDTSSLRYIRIEQISQRKEGKWFPRELNYDLEFKKYPSPDVGMRMNGHSIIDSVSFTAPGNLRFDKAYPVKLADSVDKYTDDAWVSLRMDTISIKERNTYRIIDSFSQKHKLEKIINGVGKLAMGRLPIGIIDIDMTRLFTNNPYEKTRLGIGLYTNDKLSKYYSVGGWMGYGFKDKVIKYGMSATIYPGANKDRWLQFAYKDDYQNAGNVNLHRDIDRTGFRNWLLAQIDRIKEYSATAHTQQGYWEIEVKGAKQKLISLYGNNFQFNGHTLQQFTISEASIGLRYAYGEKRVPLFGQYFSAATKYPIVYLRSAAGKIAAGDYSSTYMRVVTGLSFTKRINRWGNDNLRLEAGFIHSFNDRPLSRSFLLAAKGFRRDGLNYYAWGGFLTIRPYDYYNDQYFSVLYKHDFDKYLWHLKFSKPFVSVAHNLLYGNLKKETRLANEGIATAANGHHESGVILNQLIQVNYFNASYIYLNAGAFYHWTPSFNWNKNGVFVVGISAGF